MRKLKDPMIVSLALKAPASSLDLQKFERPLVYLYIYRNKTVEKMQNQDEYRLTAFYTRIPQGIEQSRLANIWHTDDQDIELHGMRIFLGYICKFVLAFRLRFSDFGETITYLLKSH